MLDANFCTARRTTAAILQLLSANRPIMNKVRSDVASIRSSVVYSELLSRSGSIRSDGSSVGSTLFAFDEELVNSQVYRRTLKASKRKIKAVPQQQEQLINLDEENLIDISDPSVYTVEKLPNVRKDIQSIVFTVSSADQVSKYIANMADLKIDGDADDSTDAPSKLGAKKTGAHTRLPSIEISRTPSTKDRGNVDGSEPASETSSIKSQIKPILRVATDFSFLDTEDFHSRSDDSSVPRSVSATSSQSPHSPRSPGALARSGAYRWKPRRKTLPTSDQPRATSATSATSQPKTGDKLSPNIHRKPISPNSAAANEQPKPASRPIQLVTYWNGGYHDPTYCWYRVTNPIILETYPADYDADINLIFIGKPGLNKTRVTNSYLRKQKRFKSEKSSYPSDFVFQGELGEKLKPPARFVKAICHEIDQLSHLEMLDYSRLKEKCVLVLCLDTMQHIAEMAEHYWTSIHPKYAQSPIFILGLSDRPRQDTDRFVDHADTRATRIECEEFVRKINATAFLDCCVSDSGACEEVMSAILGYSVALQLYSRASSPLKVIKKSPLRGLKMLRTPV